MHVMLDTDLLDPTTRERVATAGEVFEVAKIDRGLYVSFVIVDGDRRFRVEPMDVVMPREVERLDGSTVMAFVRQEDPDQTKFCVCGMEDVASSVIRGDDCRSLGCDDLCPACGG